MTVPAQPKLVGALDVMNIVRWLRRTASCASAMQSECVLCAVRCKEIVTDIAVSTLASR